MSFMSFKFTAPSLQNIKWVSTRPKGPSEYVPLEPRVILHELIKVGHKFVDGLSHVHMPNFCPYCVCIRKSRGLVFKGSDGCLELVCVLGAVLNRQQVVGHSLVRELVEERSHGVHRTVGDDESGAWSGVVFLYDTSRHAQLPTDKAPLTGKSGFAFLYSSSPCCTINASSFDT